VTTNTSKVLAAALPQVRSGSIVSISRCLRKVPWQSTAEMGWTECASVSCHGTKPLAREKAARDWRLGSGVVTTLIEQRSRSGCSVLRIEGGKHFNPQDRSPNEQDAHQPAALAHARRHERRFASDTQAIVANDPRGFERIGVALEPRQRSSLASPKRRGLARSGFDLVEANGRARTRGNRDARGKHRPGRETPRLPLIAGRG